MTHDLARVAPTLGSTRSGRIDVSSPVQRGYIGSCFCGKKFEASSKAAIVTAHAEHRRAMTKS